MLELLLYLYGAENIFNQRVTEYRAEHIEVIRKIHDQLFHNLDQRFTIEELSKQYLINSTTLKSLFKSVYGTSIAAHMKEHRMRQAAKMLLKSEMNIAQIASAVGYDSQSKFSTAFKSFFMFYQKTTERKYKNSFYVDKPPAFIASGLNYCLQKIIQLALLWVLFVI